jgi:hypothetical protein
MHLNWISVRRVAMACGRRMSVDMRSGGGVQNSSEWFMWKAKGASYHTKVCTPIGSVSVWRVTMAGGRWVVICKIHLRGLCEKHREPHTTQQCAPQLDQCPARSNGGWSVDVPRRCAAVVVCKIHLSGSCEGQKEPHTTQKYATQLDWKKKLDQCPARSNGECSADVSWRYAAVVVCKKHLSGSCERQKEPHTTQKYGPQSDQCPSGA